MHNDPWQIGPIRLSDILGHTAPCARCGVLCHIAEHTPSEGARIARYATEKTVTDGIAQCLACTLTRWLQNSVLAELITIEKIRMPLVQKSMKALYDSRPGNNDGSSAEIDWDALIAHWNLPFPKKRPRTKK